MNKPFLYFFLWFLFLQTKFIFGQVNLVPNPSFENYTTCPNGDGTIQLGYCDDWYDPIKTSSDFFHSCINSDPLCIPPFIACYGIPSNYNGFEYAHTGIAHAGFYVYHFGTFTNTREYLAVKLTNPLNSGSRYCMELYYSQADSSNIAIDNIGALFLNSPFPFTPPTDTFIININPQIQFKKQYLSQSLGWEKLEGDFIANGGEQHLIIGNFQLDNQLDTATIHNGVSGIGVSYYYIDDVSLIECNPVISNVPNVLTPNNDGINDFLEIMNSEVDEIKLTVYNRWGLSIYNVIGKNKIIWSPKELVDGIYYYFIEWKHQEKDDYTKGFIQVIH